MVFSTRSLSWSRELAITSLVASSRERRKSPFGNLFVITHSRAGGIFHATYFLWRESHVTALGQRVSDIAGRCRPGGHASPRGGDRCAQPRALRGGGGGGGAG